MSALLAHRSAVCRQIMSDLAEAGPWPMPISVDSFNDDDAYIYDATSKQLLREIPCSSQEVKDARHIGLRVAAGEAWAKGMTAKRLGLWRPL